MWVWKYSNNFNSVLSKYEFREYSCKYAVWTLCFYDWRITDYDRGYWKKYSRNNVDKLFAKEKIQTKNIKSFDIEVEHIIYVKLLKRKVRELRKGKRKRRKKSK